MSTPQGQQGPQLTQEQINAYFKRMLVGEQHVGLLFGENAQPQQRMQGLQQLIDGAVQEAVTRAQYLIQAEVQKVQQAYDQRMPLIDELYREHSLGQFFNKYGQLKDHRQMVEDAIAEISGLPEAPKTMEEYFEKVAKSAEGRVKSLKPDFALAPLPGAQQPPPQGQQPQQPPAAGAGAGSPTPPAYTGPSGSGVAGGAGGAPGKPSKVSDIWDDN
jgi:hypothetical protein